MSRIFEARQHLGGHNLLGKFMPYAQRLALLDALRGEEGEGIAEIVLQAVERIKGTPLTYQTESIETKDKVLCLHYFYGGVDAWIIERDVGDSGDPAAPGAGEGEQWQAYGKICLTGEGWDGAEWGYISIKELIENGVELDLYWAPKPAKEMVQ